MLYSPTVEIIEESFNVRVVTAVKYIVKSPMPIAPSAKRCASEMSITSDWSARMIPETASMAA